MACSNDAFSIFCTEIASLPVADKLDKVRVLTEALHLISVGQSRLEYSVDTEAMTDFITEIMDALTLSVREDIRAAQINQGEAS